MKSPRWVLVCGLVAGAAFACGGQIDPDSTGSTGSRSQRGADSDEPTPGTTTPGGTNTPPVATSSPPSKPPRRCGFYGGSSSGGPGDGSGSSFCQSSSFYECDGKDAQLTCECKFVNGVGKGTCSCNGDSFGFDCASGCSPSPEVYAKCNLPYPSYGGGIGTSGGSSTSSSGG